MLKLFIFAFLLNVLWEFCHSQLYVTCLKMPLPSLIRLLLRVSFFDAVWIVIFVEVINLLLSTSLPLESFIGIVLFFMFTITYAIVIEVHAKRTKRWEYAKSMPKVFGVGISPLIQLFITGILAMILILL